MTFNSVAVCQVCPLKRVSEPRPENPWLYGYMGSNGERRETEQTADAKLRQISVLDIQQMLGAIIH